MNLLVDNFLKENVFDAKTIGDKIILMKFVLGVEMINIMSAYASKVGLPESTKRESKDNFG